VRGKKILHKYVMENVSATGGALSRMNTPGDIQFFANT
jgi:hypothetical protein